MKIRSVAVAVAAAGALLAAGAAPAFAAQGPPVPAGCSFDQATGVLTCAVSATTPFGTVGPFTTPNADLDQQAPASTDFGGVTGVQICDFAADPTDPLFGAWTKIILSNVTLDLGVTTTTTTERHGLQGKVFDTTTATSLTIIDTNVGNGGIGIDECD